MEVVENGEFDWQSEEKKARECTQSSRYCRRHNNARFKSENFPKILVRVVFADSSVELLDIVCFQPSLRLLKFEMFFSVVWHFNDRLRRERYCKTLGSTTQNGQTRGR